MLTYAKSEMAWFLIGPTLSLPVLVQPEGMCRILRFPAFLLVRQYWQTQTSFRRLKIGNFSVAGVCHSSEKLKVAVVSARCRPASQGAQQILHWPIPKAEYLPFVKSSFKLVVCWPTVATCK